MRPLYYSMLLLFKDGKERCVNDVFNELKGEYSGFKMLRFAPVQEGLMTAKRTVFWMKPVLIWMKRASCAFTGR